MTLQTCAPENFRLCRWGDEQRVKHAQMVSEDPHRREWIFFLSQYSSLIMLCYGVVGQVTQFFFIMVKITSSPNLFFSIFVLDWLC